jgi:hypothetical protein
MSHQGWQCRSILPLTFSLSTHAREGSGAEDGDEAPAAGAMYGVVRDGNWFKQFCRVLLVIIPCSLRRAGAARNDIKSLAGREGCCEHSGVAAARGSCLNKRLWMRYGKHLSRSSVPSEQRALLRDLSNPIFGIRFPRTAHLRSDWRSPSQNLPTRAAR